MISGVFYCGLTAEPVIFDTDIAELPAVPAANPVNHERIARSVCEVRHRKAVVQRLVLITAQVDTAFH
jgi:hypothetical protein